VLISLAVPYVSKSQREAARNLMIDQKFIDDLKQIKSDHSALRRKLQILSESQLRTLSKLVGMPLGSKNNSMEIRTQLIQSLEAEDFWRRISGTPRGVGPSAGPGKKKDDEQGGAH